VTYVAGHSLSGRVLDSDDGDASPAEFPGIGVSDVLAPGQSEVLRSIANLNGYTGYVTAQLSTVQWAAGENGDSGPGHQFQQPPIKWRAISLLGTGHTEVALLTSNAALSGHPFWDNRRTTHMPSKS
jgi:hypothetical protein